MGPLGPIPMGPWDPSNMKWYGAGTRGSLWEVVRGGAGVSREWRWWSLFRKS